MIGSADAAWAISYITDEDGERIQAVIDALCVPSLVQLLDHKENSIIVPALRSVGNIVTGSDSQVKIHRLFCHFQFKYNDKKKKNIIESCQRFFFVSILK